MASVEAEDWRVGLSLYERQKYVLEGQYGCEVTFIVGEGDVQKTVGAHRFPLICGSSVFESLLKQKPLEEQKPIIVKDVNPPAFEEMLRFLYCEEIEISSENVMHLLFIAKKYSISQLTDKCVKFLKDSIDSENVCKILDNSVRYDENELTQKCVEFIEKDANNVMTTTAFTELSQSSLMKIIESDKLTIHDEVDVYDACIRWADRQCEREGIITDDDNKRRVLGDVLYKIRFPTMSPKAFAEITEQSSILTEKVKLTILRHVILHSDSQNTSKCNCELKFDMEPRVRLRGEVSISRFDVNQVTSPWTASGPDAIDFECNTAAVLFGCSLYGSTSYGLNNIPLKLLDSSGQVLSELSSVSLISSGTSTPIRIDFPRPVPLKAQTMYTIVTNVTGFSAFYSNGGRSSVSHQNFTMTFKSSSHSTSGHSTVPQGQIPEFHLSPI